MNQLKEAVMAVVMDTLTETSRGKKNLMRQLIDKRNKSLGKKEKRTRTFGPEGGDVQRDTAGKPKKVDGKALLTSKGKATMTTRFGPTRKGKDKKESSKEIANYKTKEARKEKARVIHVGKETADRERRRAAGENVPYPKPPKEGPFKDRD